MAALDLTRPATVRAVARRAGLTPSRRLGQHFLVDRAVLEAIIDALAPEDATVVEVGCGVGTLTAALAATASRVVALDIDPACVRATQITQRHCSNVQVVRADARHFHPHEFGIAEPWLAAGNLPYRLGGVLVRRFFEFLIPPARGVFLVQREVAIRLTAVSGDWSLATLALRSLTRIERICDVPPSAFTPEPQVHSSVIRVLRLSGPPDPMRESMLRLAATVFQQRRKTLRHGVTRALGGDAVGAATALQRARVDAGRRPGTLDLDEWLELTRAMLAVIAERQ